MEIQTWDDRNGCWNRLKTVSRPFEVVKRKFLWWEWEGARSVGLREYAIAAVREAEAMPGAKSTVQVKWRGTVIWHCGVWRIDTNDFDFSWGDPV